MNTIHHAVDVMKQNGIKAQSWKRETDQYLEYVVRIPTAGQALFAAPGGMENEQAENPPSAWSKVMQRGIFVPSFHVKH